MKLTLFLALMVTLVSAAPALAHGGGTPRLTNADAGPYWVSVWTQPDPLRVGEAHLTVAISEPNDTGSATREAGTPVLGAAVEATFTPLDDDGETLTVSPSHEGAVNKLFYEADLNLPATGRWRVMIHISGPKGSGSASFEIQVAPPSPFNWTRIALLGLVALAGVWIAQKYRGKRWHTN